ncbi:MAG TPA: XDD4 family exosortase-dependent surface protein [Casimicrobiaceae bacterium]|nr:XDD4 family exosortase-dependent surface protein [Casimicrobiaceae bacterium]
MRLKNIKNTLAAGIFALAASVFAVPASGTITFTGTGVGVGDAGGNVSASASFGLSGSTLTLILANTTATATAAQGDTLTGVVFSIDGSQTLSFDMTGPVCGQSLAGGSAIWTSTTASNTTDPLCGSWTNALAASPPISAEFGVATTGFNGEFNGGSITLGNASPDYGIVSPSTFPAASFGGSQFPFIQNGLQFVFDVTSGSFSETDITGVTFLVGTRGGTSHTIPGECIDCVINQTPEPGSLALLGLGGLLLAFSIRRRPLS